MSPGAFPGRLSHHAMYAGAAFSVSAEAGRFEKSFCFVAMTRAPVHGGAVDRDPGRRSCEALPVEVGSAACGERGDCEVLEPVRHDTGRAQQAQPLAAARQGEPQVGAAALRLDELVEGDCRKVDALGCASGARIPRPVPAELANGQPGARVRRSAAVDACELAELPLPSEHPERVGDPRLERVRELRVARSRLEPPPVRDRRHQVVTEVMKSVKTVSPFVL